MPAAKPSALVMCVAVVFGFHAASCGKPNRSVVEVADDPADETVAVFRFEDGKQVIYCGELHSRRLKKLCFGDYPSVSPSGRFVAYNPIADASHRHPAIQPIEVIEVQTGKLTSFPSIPRDLAPWPESFWSSDEALVAFQVHDFEGDRGRCVVSTVDGSYWRGTDAEFEARYAKAFGSTELQARHSAEGRLFVENFQHVGALYFRPDKGNPIRISARTWECLQARYGSNGLGRRSLLADVYLRPTARKT